MTNRDDSFLAKWRSERPNFERWGAFVCAHLTETLTNELGAKAFSSFYKVPSEPRVKDSQSLLQKAYYRNKNYADPFAEIEDKVGVRLVLLLGEEVDLVGKLIEAETSVWVANKARDHHEEIEKKPYEFDYQSLHYVVKSKGNISFQGYDIPDGLPCEIQVRTILQHAYSELAHDTLYKPSVQSTPRMKRSAAKSMALIEATGDYFNEVSLLISEASSAQTKMSKYLVEAYQELVSAPPRGEESPLNKIMIDYYDGFSDLSPEGLKEWILDHGFIGNRIRERMESQMVFQLPAILLTYYAASVAPNQSKKDNPLPDSDLENIFSDIGSSLW